MNIKITKIQPEAIIQTTDNIIELVATQVEYDYKNDLFVYHTGLTFESDSDITALILQNNLNDPNTHIYNQIYTINSDTGNNEIIIYFRNCMSYEDRIFSKSLKSFFDELINCDDISMVRDEFIKNWKINCEKKYKNLIDFAPYKKGDKITKMIFINCPMIKFTIQ